MTYFTKLITKTIPAGLRAYSTNLDISFDKYCQWFVGFSDAESCFSIVPKRDATGVVNRFTFTFSIGLHIDDIDVLYTILKSLGVGAVRKTNNECKFTVADKEGIMKLITIFDKYNLNTTKYLDYLDFKEAFNLYHSRDGQVTEELKENILNLKNRMNTNRISFDLPSHHEIKITIYWLLGLIEGEASFNLFRNDLKPTFGICLSELQLPVIIKIKEFLAQNLGFDTNSIWKLEQTAGMSINAQKARGNSKSSVLFLIKNIHILHNYLIPFFDKLVFFSKKGKDFADFKIICKAIYYGAQRDEKIKSLIIKLSYTMNNFRLSSSKEVTEIMTKEELSLLKDFTPLVEHLPDGRVRDINSQVIIHQSCSSIYIITTPTGEILRTLSLNECASLIGVNIKTLSKHLDNVPNGITLKNYEVKRVRVYC